MHNREVPSVEEIAADLKPNQCLILNNYSQVGLTVTVQLVNQKTGETLESFDFNAYKDDSFFMTRTKLLSHGLQINRTEDTYGHFVCGPIRPMRKSLKNTVNEALKRSGIHAIVCYNDKNIYSRRFKIYYEQLKSMSKEDRDKLMLLIESELTDHMDIIKVYYKQWMRCDGITEVIEPWILIKVEL